MKRKGPRRRKPVKGLPHPRKLMRKKRDERALHESVLRKVLHGK